MRTVTLKDKLLKVSEDGTIIRLNDDLSVKDEAKIHLLNRRGRNYPTLSVMIQGIQKNFYAHRVIAETFIPNPHNHRFCEIVDGNPYNLNVDNLRWMSEEERLNKVLETRKENSIKCDVCGYSYHKTKGKCSNCQHEEKAIENKLARFNRKKRKINEELKDIDVSTLKANYAEVINLRREGYTQVQIAEKAGVTKQRVGQMIIRAKNGKGRKPMPKVDRSGIRLDEKIRSIEIELAMLKEKRGKIG